MLVGAKADLANPKNLKKSKRAVKYAEAFDLAMKLNLAGFLEVSSKAPKYEVDISDIFMVTAIHCVEKSTSNPFYMAGAKPAI